MLERVEMEKLAFEKAITGGRSSDFWTACCVIDGEITQAANDAVSIRLRLERPGRSPESAQASGSTGDLRALIESLAGELMRQMEQGGLATPWDPADEARRFYMEAKSAFGAGLSAQALAAAEASQVLGYQSPALKELLLNLYVPKMFTADQRSPVKSVPAEHVDLNSALTALDIYDALLDEHVPVRWGSRGREAYELGPSALWSASRIIRWYRENGLYRSREEDLEALRKSIRHAAQLLLAAQSNASWDFFCVMACYAPYWYDEPAQALKAYDAVLAPSFNGNAFAISWVRHHLTQYRDKPNLFGTEGLDLRTSWLIGWRAMNDQGLKDLWREYVQRRVKSPVLNDRLDGRLLAFYSTDSPEAQAAIAEQAMADIWANRQTVVSNRMTFGITTELIADLYCAEEFRYKLLNCFLREGRYTDYGFFSACFGSGFTNRTHAATLLESMREFEQRVWPSGPDAHGVYNNFHGFEARLVNAFPDLREPSVDGLHVTLSWPRLNPSAAKTFSKYWPRQVLYADGALWVSGDEVLSNVFQTTFTRVELPDFTTRVFKAPFSIPQPDGNAMNGFNHAFVVAGGSLFWAHDSRLVRCRLATGQWDQAEVPTARFPLLKFLGDSLYYAFPSQPHQWAYQPTVSGVLRIDPGSLKVDILASSRRKPAQSCLDDVPAYFVYDLFSGPGNSLYASLFSGGAIRPLGELYRYSEKERQWSLVHPEVAYNFVRYRAVPFNGGNVVQPVGCALERSFILYQNGTLEFLFPDPYQRRQPLPTRWPTQSPLWQHAPWNPVVATSDGNELWVLGPRLKTRPAPLNLYLFKKGAAERKTIPLYFASPATDNYPSNDSGPIQLISVPAGLVLAGTGDTAFWFLPTRDLQAFLALRDQPDPASNGTRLAAPGLGRPRAVGMTSSKP